MALGRLNIVELTADSGARRTIHLDAEIRGLVFTDSGNLVVGTAQGIVVLEV
ncbi:hypothetical protein M8542_43995 [Amycolatopsis sp. OK19-0408]|uniref:Uncharacterized protein n=1 Tax=Amycolatopsis iheyensis TaxID=2945988 RepID=A0A9X2NNI1_9PSEU|nr:hypothetical protein [Amycolatopsis iheyensis]MCR6489797.1 hypothetical protein [Amycolatopsis iheyensis]